MSVTVTVERSPHLPSLRASRIRARARQARAAVTTVAAAAVQPPKASLRRLADIPLTVVGAGFADFAAFHVGHGWGWLATATSLIVVEHLIADPE